jgi:cytochrome c5
MTLSRVLAILFVTAIIVACSSKESNVELTDNQHALVAERIAPHGHVVMAGQAPVASVVASAGRSAESIYNVSCAACHNNGVAGAPKMGDVSAWANRLQQGLETVYGNAINGIRAMPAMGTCMDCSEDEIKITIDYILDNSQ